MALSGLSAELGMSLEGRRTLVFVAHYDDEVLFCGGTLVRAAGEGASLAIAVLTDVAYTNRPKKPGHLARWASWEPERRRRRLRAFSKVCEALRAEGRHFGLQNLSPRAETGNPLRQEIYDRGISLLSRAIDEFRPEAMLFHGAEGEYGHAQHLVAHAIARAVWQGPARCFAAPDSTCRKVFAVSVPETAKRALVGHYRYQTTQDAIWNPYAKPEYRRWCGRYEYYTSV